MAAPFQFVPNFPKANGQVQRMLLYKGVLYVSGFFTVIGGQSRNGFAAIDPVTNTVLPFVLNPQIVPGNIADFLIVNDTIYATGSFGSPRVSAGAWDVNTGFLTAWNVNLNSPGISIATDGTQIFIGGQFTNANGTPRNHLAAFDMTTGALNSWNPNANSNVNELMVVGNVVYIVGFFSQINGGTPRNNAAAVDNVTGTANAWDPNFNGPALTLGILGSSVFVGGFFGTVNGGAFSRQGFAAVDSTTGACVTLFNAGLGGAVFRIRVFNGIIYAGGFFSFGLLSQDFGTFNPADGSLLAPELNFNGLVNDFAILGSRTFFGGNFGSFLGMTLRNNLAAFIFGTNTLKGLHINTNFPIRKVIEFNSVIYIFGEFTSVIGSNGTFSRPYVAAIDPVTSQVLPFNPILDGGVLDAIVIPGIGIFMGGIFTSVNATTRNYAGAVDFTGALLPWDPDVSGAGSTNVRAFAYDGVNLYVGGQFQAVNAGAFVRHSIFKCDTVTGAADPVWDPSVDTVPPSTVQALSYDGINLYVGGSFDTVGGQPRTNLARVDPGGVGAVDVAWVFDTNVGGTVSSILRDNTGSVGNLYVGGFFNTINGTPQFGLAQIDIGTDTLIPGWANALAPDSNSPAGQTFFYSGNLYFSGSFNYIGGDFRPLITSTDAAGNLTYFKPKVGGTAIYGLWLDIASNTFYIAGEFNYINIQEAVRLAALDIPAPPPIGIPMPPVINFLNRQNLPDGQVRTLFKWFKVFKDESNNDITVSGYRIYRTSKLNLEDPMLIAEITTLDIGGFTDTIFTEVVSGFYKYCVSAFNDSGESGKSCAAGVSMQQSERLT